MFQAVEHVDTRDLVQQVGDPDDVLRMEARELLQCVPQKHEGIESKCQQHADEKTYGKFRTLAANTERQTQKQKGKWRQGQRHPLVQIHQGFRYVFANP